MSLFYTFSNTLKCTLWTYLTWTVSRLHVEFRDCSQFLGSYHIDLMDIVCYEWDYLNTITFLKQSSRCILPYITIIMCYIYTALFWVLKALYIEGGHLLNQHQCAASTWMMRWQPFCTKTLTTHQLTGGCDEANQCMGMIRRLWWSEANGEIWPGCRGYIPTLFRRTSWDF